MMKTFGTDQSNFQKPSDVYKVNKTGDNVKKKPEEPKPKPDGVRPNTGGPKPKHG